MQRTLLEFAVTFSLSNVSFTHVFSFLAFNTKIILKNGCHQNMFISTLFLEKLLLLLQKFSHCFHPLLLMKEVIHEFKLHARDTYMYRLAWTREADIGIAGLTISIGRLC